MKKGVILLIIFAVILGLIILDLLISKEVSIIGRAITEDLEDSTSDTSPLADKISDESEQVSNMIQSIKLNQEESLSTYGSNSYYSESSDGRSRGNSDSGSSTSSPSQEIVSYSSNLTDCGATMRPVFNLSLNASIQLDVAQNLVFACLANALESCNGATSYLISGGSLSGDNQFGILGKTSDSCVLIGKTNSDQKIRCTIENAKINEIFNSMDSIYPGNKAVKSYAVFDILDKGLSVSGADCVIE